MNMSGDDNIFNINNVYQPDVLPEYFAEYSQLSCLKYSEDIRVYLIEKDGSKYILKRGAGDMRDILADEYKRLKESDFSFIPKAVDFFQTEDES